MAGRKLKRFLDELHSSGAVTAAAAVVGDSRSIEYQAAAGSKRRSRPGRVTTSSLFDLASLTKPVSATLALALDARGSLPLTMSVERALASSGVEVDSGLRHRRLGSLLRHRSGLRPWTPLFYSCRRPSSSIELLVANSELLGAAPSTYSDLGYILWGLIAESATGRPVSALVRDLLVRPMGLHGLSVPPGNVPAVVECRLGNDRERGLARSQGIEIGVRRAPSAGTIQDGNARFLGGPSGHAGFFGSARAIWRLAVEWVAPGAVLVGESVGKALAGRGGYALGWRRCPPGAAKRSGLWYGHTGFTGGGVWFCPQTAEIRVLLAHRSSVSVSLKDWQARFVELRL